MRQKISIGFSPCPNDTFIFDAMIHGKIDSPYQFQPVIADVEELNELALQGALDVTKLSYSAYFNVVDQYYMLRSGSALGEGVGPLLISGTEQIEKPEEEWNVALPGKLTTAHLLFSLAYPKVSKKDFMLFNEIENAVLNGRYDAGVIIHENRFTYKDRGLHCIRDLGDFWEDQFNVPIPLGGIAAKRKLPLEQLHQIEKLVRESVDYAFIHPSSSDDFVKDHAQEMEAEVRMKHIQTYVNDYTLDLGNEGQNAIKVLGKQASNLFNLTIDQNDLFLPS